LQHHLQFTTAGPAEHGMHDGHIIIIIIIIIISPMMAICNATMEVDHSAMLQCPPSNQGTHVTKRSCTARLTACHRDCTPVLLPKAMPAVCVCHVHAWCHHASMLCSCCLERLLCILRQHSMQTSKQRHTPPAYKAGHARKAVSTHYNTTLCLNICIRCSDYTAPATTV
jgi:hypothetical protein